MTLDGRSISLQVTQRSECAKHALCFGMAPFAFCHLWL